MTNDNDYTLTDEEETAVAFCIVGMLTIVGIFSLIL